MRPSAIQKYSPLIGTYPASLLSKGYCRFMLEPCGECGTNRLGAALDSIAGTRAPLCLRCAAGRSVLLRFLRMPLLWDEALTAFASFQPYRRTVRAIVSGVALFGPRLPQPAGFPLKAEWSVTSKCNLACLHCCADAKKRRPRGELDTKEAFAAVDSGQGRLSSRFPVASRC